MTCGDGVGGPFAIQSRSWGDHRANSKRQRHRLCIQLCVALALTAEAPALAAQDAARATIHGRVTTDSGQRLLAGVEILVEGSAAAVRSGQDGRFILSASVAGPVMVLVRHPGFRPLRDSIHVEGSAAVERNFDLVPLATKLAGVEVREEGGLTNAAFRDFDRRRKGTGKFLVQADIERIGTKSLESLIRGHIGGFSLVRLPNGGVAVAGKRRNELSLTNRPAREPGLPDRCYAEVFVNGQRFYAYQSPPSMPPRLDDFDLERIVALEFYRGPAETPTEFSGPSAACGTIAIWTHVATPT